MTNPADRRGAIVRLLAFALLFVVVGVLIQRYAGDVLLHPIALVARLRAAPGAALVFVLIYAGATSLALPATPFTLAGGILFGVAEGTLLNWTAASLGATGSFLLARWLGADAVRVVLGRHAHRLDWLTERTSTATILRLRLIPIVPFDGLSVAAGLARMPIRPFVVGTTIGIIPGTLVYTWFARSLVDGATAASRTAFVQLTAAGTLLVILSFLPTLIKRVRKTAPPRDS
jgi:uncharacterized membrane protein YdjX (TVP38/TMEM64 family)